MDDNRKLWSLKRHGHNYEQIAAITGLTEEEVRERMRCQRAGTQESVGADPNEYLIQLTTSAIQLSWSPGERRRRRLLPDLRVRYDRPVSLTPSQN